MIPVVVFYQVGARHQGALCKRDASKEVHPAHVRSALHSVPPGSMVRGEIPRRVSLLPLAEKRDVPFETEPGVIFSVAGHGRPVRYRMEARNRTPGLELLTTSDAREELS